MAACGALHDAPEYVIGDMISPVKAAVGPGYARWTIGCQAAIHIRFGLPAVLPARGQGDDQEGRPHLGLDGGGRLRERMSIIWASMSCCDAPTLAAQGRATQTIRLQTL
jgi:hypothetical protein